MCSSFHQLSHPVVSPPVATVVARHSRTPRGGLYRQLMDLSVGESADRAAAQIMGAVAQHPLADGAWGLSVETADEDAESAEVAGAAGEGAEDSITSILTSVCSRHRPAISRSACPSISCGAQVHRSVKPQCPCSSLTAALQCPSEPGRGATAAADSDDDGSDEGGGLGGSLFGGAAAFRRPEGKLRGGKRGGLSLLLFHVHLI